MLALFRARKKKLSVGASRTREGGIFFPVSKMTKESLGRDEVRRLAQGQLRAFASPSLLHPTHYPLLAFHLLSIPKSSLSRLILIHSSITSKLAGSERFSSFSSSSSSSRRRINQHGSRRFSANFLCVSTSHSSPPPHHQPLPNHVSLTLLL